MNKTMLGAGVAALLPFLTLQACVVEDAEDNFGIAPDQIVTEDDCTVGEARWCDQEIDASVQGEQSCIEDGGLIGWTGCAPRVMDSADDCYEGEDWDGERCVPTSGQGSTPIVMSFGHASVQYGSGGGDFDLTGHGYNVSTDWPTAHTPWLAFDRDGSGAIESGAELFGSATRLASGAFARHGFEALAELDDDGDGRITAADQAFGALTLWADHNGDRVSQPNELTTLHAAGITAISVAMTVVPRCDTRGNCERERASFTYVVDGESRTGSAVDVHLAWQ